MITALETLQWRTIGRRNKQLSLSMSKDFDSRWIGELPIVFDGTPAEIVAYAEAQGCQWMPDDNLLYGGRFEHPDEPLTLYPT